MLDGDPVVRKLEAEIVRLQDAKRRALAIADERGIEADRLRADRWKPGDPRCDVCDNGLEKSWVYCPFCGTFILRQHGDGK